MDNSLEIEMEKHFQIEMEQLELRMLMNEFEIGARNGEVFSEEFFAQLCNQREWETYEESAKRQRMVNAILQQDYERTSSNTFFDGIKLLIYSGIFLFIGGFLVLDALPIWKVVGLFLILFGAYFGYYKPLANLWHTHLANWGMSGWLYFVSSVLAISWLGYSFFSHMSLHGIQHL